MNKQFPLNISLEDGVKLESFILGANQQAITELRRCVQGEGERFLFLWGGNGTGKSHLLQGACREAAELGRTVAYVPLTLLPRLRPELFANLEKLDLVCLDDLQRIAGLPEWEEALFHLFNRLHERNAGLLVTADCSPSALPVRLADLASRLCWGTAYRLVALTDAEKQLALIEGAARRGMQLAPETAGYILNHYPRDMGSLLAFLDRLDRATLAEQRKPTLPFVRELLKNQE
jgi:DnaA family protein